MAHIMIERRSESSEKKDSTRRRRIQKSEDARLTSETTDRTSARIHANSSQQYFGIDSTRMQNYAATYRRDA